MSVYFKVTLTIWLASLVILTSCFGPQNYLPVQDPPPLEPFCVPDKIRVALVLGSGGIRGMAHVGVLEELTQAGINFDLIVGCSAGSIVGALYADNPDIEHIKSTVGRVKTDLSLI